MQIALFEIKLLSHKLDPNFNCYVKYVINSKHSFWFQVNASIDPVKLELEKKNIKLSFSEENIEMETFEILKVYFVY